MLFKAADKFSVEDFDK